VNGSSVRLPKAVPFPSSSSSSDSASYISCADTLTGGEICSVEIVITGSSSLSLSSYSSWLLVLLCLFPNVVCDGPAARLRRRGLGACDTRNPVVTISSPIEESDDEDGSDDISTQDSARWKLEPFLKSMFEIAKIPSWRNLSGTVFDLSIAATFLLLCLL
jgi:hypothetical protein